MKEIYIVLPPHEGIGPVVNKFIEEDGELKPDGYCLIEEMPDLSYLNQFYETDKPLAVENSMAAIGKMLIEVYEKARQLPDTPLEETTYQPNYSVTKRIIPGSKVHQIIVKFYLSD